MMRILNFFSRHRFLSLLLVGVAVILVISYLLGSSEELRFYALDMQNGHILWSLAAPADMALWGRPAVADGRVFVASASNPPADTLYAQYPWKLTAYRADTGSQLWEFTLDQTLRGEISASFVPVPFGDQVFVAVVTEQHLGRLLALDAASGKLRWAVDGLYFPSTDFFGLNSELSGITRYGAYAVAGSSVYAVLKAGPSDASSLLITALDAATGAKRWQTAFGDKTTYVSALIRAVSASDKTVSVSAEDKMYTFDAPTGALQATSNTDQGIVVITGGMLYRRDQQNRIIAQDATSGDVKWQLAPPKDDPLLGCTNLNADADRVYAFCELKDFNKDLADAEKADPKNWTSLIMALDASTGREIWRKPAAYNLYTLAWQTPVLGKGVVSYIGGSFANYRLMALAQTDGSVQWSFALHDGSDTAFSDGQRIYVNDRAPRLRYGLALLNPGWH